MPRGVLDRVVRTEPLVSAGKSGAALERGWLDDGSTVVIKHVDPSGDWVMQALGDHGRVAALWAAGLFDRLPPSVEHATLDVVPRPTGATVVMRDVSAHLLGDTAPAPAARRVLFHSVAAMHAALGDVRPAPLCPLATYLAFLSPRVCGGLADYGVPRLAIEGWSRFRAVVDDDVVAIIDAVHAAPNLLADALLARRSTVVHGDLKLANLGVDGDRTVIVDWGTPTTWAPPAVDFAWFVAINAAATGCTERELLDEIRLVQGADHDPVAQSLALVGALAQLGWEKALGATSDDPLVARRERAGLAWWSAAVRAAPPI